MGPALREHGWRITYLGADTPLASIDETATALRPDLVVIAAVDEALAAQVGACHLREGPVEAAAVVASSA